MDTLLKLLPSARQKTASEWAAPCPWCGGHDRFVLHPADPPTGKWWCRGCGRSGDGIALLMELKGMPYEAACRAFGIVPKSYPAGRGKASQNRNMGHLRAYQRRPAQQANPSPCKVKTDTDTDTVSKLVSQPPEAWQTRAAAFADECLDAVGSTREACWELYGHRSLYPAGARRAGVGWNDRPRFESRTAWGLPPNAGSTRPDLLVLPRGIVIITRRAGAVVNLTIRRTATELAEHPERQKYHQAAGSAVVPYIVGGEGLPVVLVESALDAALLTQEAGDIVAAVALMGATKAPDTDTAAFVSAAPLVIACPDNDPAGRKALDRWRTFFPCEVCAVPPMDGYKDLTEMHHASLDFFNRERPLTVRRWAALARHLARKAARQKEAA